MASGENILPYQVAGVFQATDKYLELLHEQLKGQKCVLVIVCGSLATWLSYWEFPRKLATCEFGNPIFILLVVILVEYNITCLKKSHKYFQDFRVAASSPTALDI
jgi:hypothetical protein